MDSHDFNFTKRGWFDPDKTRSKQRGKFIRSNNAQQQKAILIVWNLGDPSITGSMWEFKGSRGNHEKNESSTLVVSSCLSFFPNDILVNWSNSKSCDNIPSIYTYIEIYIDLYLYASPSMVCLQTSCHSLMPRNRRIDLLHGWATALVPLWTQKWIAHLSPNPFKNIGLDPSWPGVSDIGLFTPHKLAIRWGNWFSHPSTFSDTPLSDKPIFSGLAK